MGGHHGARTGACGVDEIGHPHVPVERFAVERLTGLRGELEVRNIAEYLKFLGLDAGPHGESQRDQKRLSHAALLVLFCDAISPEIISSTNPKPAVTAALVSGPGEAFGSPSSPLS